MTHRWPVRLLIRLPTVHTGLTEPLIEDFQADLHGALLGEQLLCDYHGTPVSLATDDPVLIEAIRILDPQYKAHEEVRWLADAVRSLPSSSK